MEEDIARGFVYHEMIEEMGLETELSVGVIIQLVADALDTTVVDIRQELRQVGSPFICGSGNIIGYIDGKPMKRTTVKYKVDTLLVKVGKKVYGKEKPPIEDLPLFLKLLKNHLSVGFFDGAPQL